MTQDSQFYIMIASLGLITIGVFAYTILKLWREWMAFKRAELKQSDNNGQPPVSTMSRIEVADLKERVRKLEAIAAGIDI